MTLPIFNTYSRTHEFTDRILSFRIVEVEFYAYAGFSIVREAKVAMHLLRNAQTSISS